MGLDPASLSPAFRRCMVSEPVKLPPSHGTITSAKQIMNVEEIMNKTERRCYDELVRSGQYTEVIPWAITLYLGHRCKYTPAGFKTSTDRHPRPRVFCVSLLTSAPHSTKPIPIRSLETLNPQMHHHQLNSCLGMTTEGIWLFQPERGPSFNCDRCVEAGGER